MNSKKMLSITFCLGLATGLYFLARYQLDYADEAVERNGESLIHVLASKEDLSTLTKLINRAGLHAVLEKADSVTIVAPTNDAFERLRSMLGDDAYNRIINDSHQLSKLLSHHIILNKESTDELSTEGKLPTLGGTSIHIRKSSAGAVRLDDRASIIPENSNIDTGKAFIHSIDEVIVPERLE